MMNSRGMYFFILALVYLPNAAAITEYVGLGPAGNIPGQTNTSISKNMKWLRLDYESTASSAKEIKGEFLTGTIPELGHWFELDLTKGGGDGLALTAKIYENKMYALIEKNGIPPGAGHAGCCADTLRIYERDSGNVTEIDTEKILDSIFPSSTKFHHATHTFDIQPSSEGVIAYVVVLYDDIKLGGVQCNGVVAFNTVTGKVVHTQDGEAFFSFPDHIGTTSTTFADSIFKVQYEKQANGTEWHGNGMLLFEAADGTKLLGFTHRDNREGVVLKDPYSYKHADGGGNILQRFGTPHYTASVANVPSSHFFGLPAGSEVLVAGLHNMFYTRSSPTSKLKGKETLTFFVNGVAGQVHSFAYEFELALKEQKAGVTYDDTVFLTEYVRAECNFTAQAMGGARPIADGVFVVASGIPTGQIEIVDVAGDTQDFPYESPSQSSSPPLIGLYDSFIRVVAEP